MSASYTHLSCQLLLLLMVCRHVNTKNTTVITEPPVETSGPNTPPVAPLTPLQTGQKSVVLTGENHTEKVEVVNPVTLNLECAWTGNNKRLPNITGYWTKDGKTIETSYSNIQLQNGRYYLRREFSIMNEEDLGTYSCIFDPKAKVDFILAAPYLGEVRDKPIVSYVGDSVVMICKMDEKKPKPLSWNWYKQNGTNKVKIEVDSPGHRYKITKDEKKAKLVVHNLTESDSGLYYCGAVYGIGTSVGYLQLRVITYFEPLKPFIGILVEVLVLVAVILIYEKTGSKKDDQSGAEGNPDQNTNQLHGENAAADGRSSTRQRKV
ncbi:embigin isoform X2 [Boleophthalmus pectinirostris]|uniref:embigin isoform X2 n=1 Tax=Boleophthalmus pectinirostris TaxID=150288 RepID=UPI0024302255|nr:embigin isoform X2 [Boleophthalmus pectinirostris]